jgi:drug/metabolite transporter (DMT)-like permease
MYTLFPLIAAVLQASSFTLDKTVLGIRRVSYKTYTGASFPLLFVVTLAIFFIFRPPIPGGLFSPSTFFLLTVSVALTVVTNLLFYRALDSDKLGEIEALNLLHSISIIIFSSIIFADERNYAVVVPALVASIATLWAHWEKHHLEIARKTAPFLVWSIAAAPIGAAVSKVLLETWSPISLELIRTGVIAVIFLLIFYKDAIKISRKVFLLLIGTNILSATAWILFYTSYQRLGVVYTVLIFSLQPLLVYFFAVIFLKEKFHWKKFIAFMVVLASIAIARFIS